MTIGPIVEWLQVKKQENNEQTVGQEVVTTMVDHFMTGVSDILAGFEMTRNYVENIGSYQIILSNPVFWDIMDATGGCSA